MPLLIPKLNPSSPLHVPPPSTASMDVLTTLRNWLALPFANALTDDPEPFTIFQFFPKLPEELRCLIWSYAPRNARVIQIHYIIDKAKWETFHVEETCGGMPPALHVSREARKETMRAYTKAFGTHIDLRRDTLFISDHTFPLRKQRRMLMDMECIKGLQNLALREDVLGGIVEMEREFKKWKFCDSLAEVLGAFEELRHFSVVLATEEPHSIDDHITTTDDEEEGEEDEDEEGYEGKKEDPDFMWTPHNIDNALAETNIMAQYPVVSAILDTHLGTTNMDNFYDFEEHGELQYEEDEGSVAEWDFENGASTTKAQDKERLDQIEAEAFEEMSAEVRYPYATPIHLQSACKDTNYNNPSDLALAISIDKHFRRGKEASPDWKRPSFSVTAVRYGLRDIDDSTPLVHYVGDYGGKVTEKYPYGDGIWPRYRGRVKSADAVDEAAPGYWD